jgi:CheY-like chemotaxis protein
MVPTARRRILIIDDDADVAQATQRVMQHAGYEAQVALSALNGLELARQSPPDVVLLDLSMPTFDGLDTVHVLRTEPATRDSVVVAFSGELAAHDAKRLKSMGFDHVLSKPVEPADLVKHVARFLKTR